MPDTRVYDPLDYENLTRSVVRELMQRGPFSLPVRERFTGAGVYSLFYSGDFELYSPIRSSEATHPVYVGSALFDGGRTGLVTADSSRASPLYGRLVQHARSIAAVDSLNVQDFQCRYLVVTPLWITMAEHFLIQHYRPLWNVCLFGFGNHNPGSGRHAGEAPWWDALHPGRPWATRLRQVKTFEAAMDRVSKFLSTDPSEQSHDLETQA